MKIFIFAISALLLVGCASTQSGDLEPLSDEEKEARQAEEEELFREEVSKDLYDDTKQVKSVIYEAYREGRNLDDSEKILYDDYMHKYDDYSVLNWYEGEIHSYIRELNIALMRYNRDDPVLDSEDSHLTNFQRTLKKLRDTLDKVDTY
ncbi:hypothetical protein [Alteribacter populi]|uniref:hypothetical protein n=1 Tax=Alteribacter populi TaxID=2011011 RepID=UPI000BBB5BFA|nr:hypothetical protein [Alteribacter populi]